MELILPMYNVHPYLSLKNLGKKVHIIQSKIRYFTQKTGQSGRANKTKGLTKRFSNGATEANKKRV